MKQLFSENEFQNKYNIIKHILTESNKETIFPIASLIGGQPGSGKSQLSKFILAQNPNTIIIDGDYIREFHPHLKEIAKIYGEEYPKATQPFVNRMVEQLINDLSKEKYNLIIEGTLRDIKVPQKTAQKLNDRDYMVELYIIATDKELSWQSTIDRGDNMKEDGKNPRYVDKDHHDQIVENLPKTVELLSKDDLFCNIIIMNRDQEVLYDKNKSPQLDSKSIMEKSLEGKTVTSLDEVQKEISRLVEMKNNIEESTRKDKHRNNHNYDFER